MFYNVLWPQTVPEKGILEGGLTSQNIEKKFVDILTSVAGEKKTAVQIYNHMADSCPDPSCKFIWNNCIMTPKVFGKFFANPEEGEETWPAAEKEALANRGRQTFSLK